MGACTCVLSESAHVKRGFHSLSGKIVGMLLEGLPHERLECLCADATELKELVDLASPLLEIQRLELASQDVTPASLQLLERLELVLAQPADAKSPQRANVICSQVHAPTRKRF